MRVVLFIAIAGAYVAVAPARLNAQSTCPEAPNRVSVILNVAATFDPLANLYTYSYTVISSPESEQEISDFAVDVFGAISDIRSPRGWIGDMAADRATVMWHAYENAPVDPNEPDDGGTLPGVYQVKPGQILGGFEFKSEFAALPVNFYAVGYVPVPTAASEEEAETMLEECPDSTGSFFDLAFVGITSGPVQLFQSSFTVRDMQAERAPSPREPTAGASTTTPRAAMDLWEPVKMPMSVVAVLSTRDFDGQQVRVGSIKVGERLLADIHGAPHVEDANVDGRLDVVIHVPSASIQSATVVTAQLVSGAQVRATRAQ
jgi:hypothetical protein